MLDIQNIPPIITHLQTISKIYKVIRKDQISIHCPYCDDAHRPNAASHGHLYIHTSNCVFYCFRCDSSGTLLKLLLTTNFKDESILKSLSNNIKYIFSKDYYSFKKKHKLFDIKQKIKTEIIKLTQNNIHEYLNFQNYIFQRLGENIDFSDFLICPGKLFNNSCCDFYNLETELIIQRHIKQVGKYRFKLNQKSSGLYYFQEKNFEKHQRIVLTEGPFDLLNLYIYNSDFKDCIFFSVSGKKYINIIERLILEDLLIGNYEINLIFDSDNNRCSNYIYRAKMLCSQLNSDISIRGFMPLIKGDVGDYPAVIEV